MKGIWALALVHYVVTPVGAQIGVSLCACQPSVYTFQFNFDDICNQTDVAGPGIVDWSCFVQGLNEADGVTDFKPVAISTVEVLEWNQNFDVIASRSYDDGYTDGATIRYVSIAGNPATVQQLGPELIPAALQLSIIGVNANEEPIINTWVILFDNLCGLFPVLEVGEHIGWTSFVGLERSLTFVCPAASPAPTSSSMPSSSVSTTPSTSMVPSIPISRGPSASPLPSSTRAPSLPTESDAPSCVPSYSPVGGDMTLPLPAVPKGKGLTSKAKTSKSKYSSKGGGSASNTEGRVRLSSIDWVFYEPFKTGPTPPYHNDCVEAPVPATYKKEMIPENRPPKAHASPKVPMKKDYYKSKNHGPKLQNPKSKNNKGSKSKMSKMGRKGKQMGKGKGLNAVNSGLDPSPNAPDKGPSAAPVVTTAYPTHMPTPAPVSLDTAPPTAIDTTFQPTVTAFPVVALLPLPGTTRRLGTGNDAPKKKDLVKSKTGAKIHRSKSSKSKSSNTVIKPGTPKTATASFRTMRMGMMAQREKNATTLSPIASPTDSSSSPPTVSPSMLPTSISDIDSGAPMASSTDTVPPTALQTEEPKSTGINDFARMRHR